MLHIFNMEILSPVILLCSYPHVKQTCHDFLQHLNGIHRSIMFTMELPTKWNITTLRCPGKEKDGWHNEPYGIQENQTHGLILQCGSTEHHLAQKQQYSLLSSTVHELFVKIVCRMKSSNYSKPLKTMAIAVETFRMLYVPGTSTGQPLKSLWELPCFLTSTS
jgi:hypothetical protein